MKWFKHYTRAHEDRAIEKLIMEYGVAGYGLYIYCLEIIAGSVEPDNLTFELEPDAPILARRLSMDTILVERIMHSCIEMGLFELSDSGRLTCFKIRKYIDQNMTSNPQMREILRKSPRAEITSQSQVSHKTVTQTCDQIRLDKIRLEEEEKSADAIASSPPRFKKPDIEDVSAYCQERSNGVDPAKWMAHYEANGWRVGKNPMKDWKAAVRTWEPAGFRAPRREAVKVCPHCGSREVDGLCRNPDCPQYDEAFRGGKAARGGK